MKDLYLKNRILILFVALITAATFIVAPLLDAHDIYSYADEQVSTVAINKRSIKSTTIKSPKKLKYSGKTINLRTMIDEPDTGYSVVQGSCTDGTYAYYMMVSSQTQKGRILKLRMKDNKVVGRSKIVDVNHGNGICYDSKRKMVVSATYYDNRQKLAFFDAASLNFKGYKNVKFTYYKDGAGNAIGDKDLVQGITAISYNARYDAYVAMESKYHHVMIYNAESLEAIGKARTNLNKEYPGIWQSMDSDDQYVYYVLSQYNSAQPYNIILCIYWHSENLEPVLSGEKEFIEDYWMCGAQTEASKRDGKPSAVIRVNTPYEVESLFHVNDASSGKSHFYLSEYHSAPKYKWVKVKVKYKAKWKKVKKRVKWKKVNGKWKYKTKKVWKYKTKYKKVWKKKQVGLYRNDYVYDLGVF